MFTRCEHCSAVFRVAEGQLEARGGRVRCGHCSLVFNAADNLVDWDAQARPEPDSLGAVISRAPEPAEEPPPAPSELTPGITADATEPDISAASIDDADAAVEDDGDEIETRNLWTGLINDTVPPERDPSPAVVQPAGGEAGDLEDEPAGDGPQTGADGDLRRQADEDENQADEWDVEDVVAAAPAAAGGESGTTGTLDDDLHASAESSIDPYLFHRESTLDQDPPGEDGAAEGHQTSESAKWLPVDIDAKPEFADEEQPDDAGDGPQTLDYRPLSDSPARRAARQVARFNGRQPPGRPRNTDRVSEQVPLELPEAQEDAESIEALLAEFEGKLSKPLSDEDRVELRRELSEVIRDPLKPVKPLTFPVIETDQGQETSPAHDPDVDSTTTIILGKDRDGIRQSNPFDPLPDDMRDEQPEKAGRIRRKIRIPQPRRAGGRRWPWWVALLALVLISLWQFRHTYVPQLATSAGSRPVAELFCKLALCDLPPLTELASIEILQTRVSPHPDTPGALRLEARLLNRASFSQPLPLIELSLVDQFGVVLGRRQYAAEQYARPVTRQTMPAGGSNTVVLDLADPDEKTVGYELGVVSR